MKKLMKVCFVIAAMIPGCLLAQKGSWIEFGLTGSGGANIITNKNIWNDQKTVTSDISLCYGFGGKLALNINESHELLLNVEYGIKNQNYEIKIDSTKFNKNIVLKTIDMAFLYRYHNDDGAYVEIGPQLSLIKSVTENRDGISKDVTAAFNKSYVSGVFGFGSNFIQSNAFTLAAGFRINYSLTDLISNGGGSGNAVSYPLNDVKHFKSYDTYSPTKAFSIMLHTEFNFDLGYFVRSNCNRKRVSFLSF